MDLQIKQLISSNLSVLGLDIDKDSDLAYGYFIVSLANARIQKDISAHIDTSSPALRSYLSRYCLPIADCCSSQMEQQSALASLIAAFQENDWFANHRHFFDCFSPYIVDWEKLTRIIPIDNGKAAQLATLTAILLRTESLKKPFDLDTKLNALDDVYAPNREYFETLFTSRNLPLTKENFEQCFNSVYRLCRANLPAKINGPIQSAIKAYSAEHVPMTCLLTDYSLVKKHRKELTKALNPWQHVQHKEHAPTELRLTAKEPLFENCAMRLKDQCPTDVIRAIFYGPTSSDSDFECSILLSDFCKKVKPNTNVLIVHPSPDLILHWVDSTHFASVRTTFAVPNTTIAELYRGEFPNASFVTFEQIKTLKHIDYALLTPRNVTTPMVHLLDTFAVCNSGAELVGLFSNILFDKNEHGVKELLRTNKISVERMLLVSSKAVHSSPRKKVLLHLHKGSASSEAAPILTWKLSCWDDGSYYVSKEHFQVPAKDFFAGTLTIKDMLTHAVKRKRSGDIHRVPVYRNGAMQYPFSAEIMLRYTIRRKADQSFAGRAYYCSCRIPEESNRHRGKRLTDFIEAGLHAKNEEDVIRNLERIPFDERVYPHIKSDILDYYSNQTDKISLKSLWFLLHEELLRKKKYNENLCTSMFCGELQTLSNIVPQNSKPADYICALNPLLGNETKAAQLQYWVQLDLIFRTGISSGFVHFNPVFDQVAELSNQASEEQREVRNALVKRTFTQDEEERILQYITAKTDVLHNDRHQRRYEAESIWLAGAIKLFTGISNTEVCALQWGDLVKLNGVNLYQLIITKHVDEKGNLLEYEIDDHFTKIRPIPVSPLLEQLLNHRYRYLCEVRGSAPKEDEPIILRSENKRDLHCARPRYVREKCDILIEQANIPPQILYLPDSTRNDRETNLNDYHGDIFTTNFKYRALHTCFLTHGELNFIQGLEPPTTYDRHYCDYSADIIQYAIAHKLRRWCSVLPLFTEALAEDTHSQANSLDTIVPKNKNAAADLIISADTDIPTSFTIEIECEHGFTVKAIQAKTGDLL